MPISKNGFYHQAATKRKYIKCCIFVYVLVAVGLLMSGIFFLLSASPYSRSKTISEYNKKVDEWISTYYPIFSGSSFSVETDITDTVIPLQKYSPIDKLNDENQEELSKYDNYKVAFKASNINYKSNVSDIRLLIGQKVYSYDNFNIPKRIVIEKPTYSFGHECRDISCENFRDDEKTVCEERPHCRDVCEKTLQGTYSIPKCLVSAYLESICILVNGGNDKASSDMRPIGSSFISFGVDDWAIPAGISINTGCYNNPADLSIGLSENFPAKYSKTRVDSFSFEIRHSEDPFIQILFQTNKSLDFGTSQQQLATTAIVLVSVGGVMILALLVYSMLMFCGSKRSASLASMRDKAKSSNMNLTQLDKGGSLPESTSMEQISDPLESSSASTSSMTALRAKQ